MKSLTWPICIAACLADGDHKTFFERLERGVVDEYGRNQRILRALSIARECWRLRDRRGSSVGGKAYDWRDSMASLGEMVLLF